MRILVSNDDGISAPGIVALASAAGEFGSVIVAAPNRERSAASHSLTIGTPLRMNKVRFPVPVSEAYSVSGTPSDCVKLAMSQGMDSPPDLILSGINRGANVSVDIFYSGTVAAAFEGVFDDIPAVAFSLDTWDSGADFAHAQRWVKKTLARLIDSNLLDKRILFNVNIPDLSPRKVKGFRFTRMGRVRYRDSYERRHDPGGHPYFWLKGAVEILDEDPDCDINALKDGYVSVTPIRPELTAFEVLDAFSEVPAKAGRKKRSPVSRCRKG